MLPKISSAFSGTLQVVRTDAGGRPAKNDS